MQAHHTEALHAADDAHLTASHSMQAHYTEALPAADDTLEPSFSLGARDASNQKRMHRIMILTLGAWCPKKHVSCLGM